MSLSNCKKCSLFFAAPEKAPLFNAVRVHIRKGVGIGEIISLRSIRPKAVIDAELHRLDGLLDVDPWDHFGDTSNRAGQ
jgi:hypothetical protein